MMKHISTSLFLLLFSLVSATSSYAVISSSSASLVDTNQNQAFESEPTHSFKLAAVHFITNNKALNFGNQEFLPEDLCKQGGYIQTAQCSSAQMPNKKCSYNSSYYDKCVCKSSLVDCTYPQSGVGESCGGKYQSCQCPATYKSCECGCASGAISCTLDGVTTCSDCKSCCNSSSSDWCSVHDTCHGDCCSDGSIESCDERCGGSGCTSSGGSDGGSSCQSGSGDAYASCSCGSHPRIQGYYVATSSTYYVCDDGNTRDHTVEWLATPNEAECEDRVSRLEADGYCRDYRFSGYPCGSLCD